MRKLTASLFLTLDGVYEAPGRGDVTLPEHSGWSEPYMTQELGEIIFGQMHANDSLLLGRVGYEGFAAFWPNVPESDPFSARMNGMTKYVVSTTLDRVDWKNSELVRGDLVEAITAIKARPGKDIGMTGSGRLVRSLLQLDLIDELQLCVCPVVLGTGKRLFEHDGQRMALQLADTKAFSSGMVMLTYRPTASA